MFDRYTERARRSLLLARGEAERHQHDHLTTAHILLGLIKEGSGLGLLLLERLGVNIEQLKQELERRIPYGRRGFVMGAIPFAPDAKKVLEYAMEEAKYLHQDYIGTEHLVLGILREKTGLGGKLLRRLGVEGNEAREILKDMVGEEGLGRKKRHKKTPALDEFGMDLTEMAREGKLDPVIGRTKEIERVIQILVRKTKNNPVLIGEPGVGKTAIVEGLAQRIVEKEVPEPLMNRRLISLDLGAIVAGTKYRGQFESRMKAIIKEASEDEDVMLFIDEIHTLVGAGAAEGSIDAANMLKPALARGDIHCIGATTLSEYRKYIEKDGALERRFQVVMVEPPTVEETLEILRGLRSRYEEFHHVEITDEALVAAARLADRYMTDKFLPDKAIDLLDEACSMVHIRCSHIPAHIREVELELDRLEQRKRQAINNQEFEKAAGVRDEELQVLHRLRDLRREWLRERDKEKPKVTETDVALVISNATGIPLNRLSAEEEKRLLDLESELKAMVVGQDEAVERVAKAIRKARVGLRSHTRPVGAFFFLGPTGVGKTRLAEALAEVLFGGVDALLRFDMSEYMEKFNVSRLIGAPPGYVGYDEGGQLTEAVRRRPYSVILFDEMEKAHPEVFNILLQIFDSGRLTDAFGRTVDFKNTLIIMTSNIGAKLFFKGVSFGFGESETDFRNIKNKVLSQFKRRFAPEFINRLDDVIVFNPLGQEEVLLILDLVLDELRGRLEERGMRLRVTPRARRFLVSQGFDAQMGARPLRRAVERLVSEPLSEEILRGAFSEGDTIVVDVVKQKVRFKKGGKRRAETTVL